MPQVRRARPDDAAAIARIHVAGWQEGYRGLFRQAVLDALSIPEHEQAWRDRLRDGVTTWVSEDGPVRGFLAIASNDSDDGHLPDAANIGALYTDPESWGAGHGAALLETALGWVRAQRLRKVTLWVVEGNERAIGFYARRGFRFDGANYDDAERGARELRMLAELKGERDQLHGVRRKASTARTRRCASGES